MALLVFIAVCYFKFCSHSSSNEGTVCYYIANNYVFICAFIFVLFLLFNLFNIRTFIADHWPLIFAVTTGLLVVAVYLHHFYDNPISSDPEKWGPFGDYIGGILNPTFTFVMLYLVWQTLVVQQEGLKKQREAQERLEKDLQHQKFEDRFFKLLELYRQKFIDGNQITKIHGQLNTEYLQSKQPGETVTELNCYKTIIERKCRSSNGEFPRPVLIDYFGFLFIILRFLEKSSPDAETKEDYADLLRRLLSMEEKTLLHYHCEYLTEKEQEAEAKEFRDLVEKFLLRKLGDWHQTLG
ncbi:MAG: hypothetical protein BWK78_07595 [Thiotrichaceae bacterium IS1]|nr:MAG: hypothetical protein BWK78_07595 [Thiotrichaceae bacterium IS1]